MSQTLRQVRRTLLLATTAAIAVAPGMDVEIEEAEAGAPRRLAVRKVARPARGAAAPLAQRKKANDALIESLSARKKGSGDVAEREVAAMTDAEVEAFLFTADAKGREKATKARKEQYFTRTPKRILDAAKIVDNLLAQEAAATDPAQQARLQEMQSDILGAAVRNKKLGMERNVRPKVKWFAQHRLPRIFLHLPFLRRDTQWAPGTIAYNVGATDGMERTDELDPIDSTMWKQRKPERITSEALHAGPWVKADKRPTLPAETTVLELEGFRNVDADGIHPSVFVTDPVTGEEWKVKFQKSKDRPVSEEAIMSRFLYALGYHSAPVHHTARLRLDPRAVIAAYKYKQKIGITVRYGGFLHRFARIKPGKYGFSTPYRMPDHIVELSLKGTVLVGAAAAAKLEEARRNPALLKDIEYVTVQGVDIGLKGESGGESIGPFDLDDPLMADRREMRALAFISQTWGLGEDMRFNNTRLDVEEEDGALEIEHRLSDAGAHFRMSSDLNALPWEVDFDLQADRIHNDNNGYTLRAYDRATIDDARWGARKLAALTEEQITAIVTAEAESWPVARLYVEKMISRRDSLVKKLGIEREIPLLRPNGADRTMDLTGSGRVKLTDAKGQVTWRIIPAGAFQVRRGQVVPK